jgi:threonine/homoserine/homoserine lactone efflux protein
MRTGAAMRPFSIGEGLVCVFPEGNMLSTQFLVTALIVVLVPGTGVIYTISTGLFQGGRASIFAAFGCTLGIVPSLSASILGLAVVIHASAMAFQAVKYAGIAYLLYLAWSMWKETGVLDLNREITKGGLFRVVLKGFLINILNPKLTLFFLAFFPQFIPQHTQEPAVQMMILGSVFMAMTFLIFVVYGLLSTRVRDYIVRSAKVTRIMQRTFAASFALLAAKLALSDR